MNDDTSGPGVRRGAGGVQPGSRRVPGEYQVRPHTVPGVVAIHRVNERGISVGILTSIAEEAIPDRISALVDHQAKKRSAG